MIAHYARQWGLSAISNRISRPGDRRAIWRHSSEPIDPSVHPPAIGRMSRIETYLLPHFQGCHKRSDQTAMSRLIESYGTVGLTFPRGVFVFMSSTTPNCSRIARSAETFFTSLMTTFANA